MSTDLFFAPPAPQSPSTGFRHDSKIGSADSVRFYKTGTTRNSTSPGPDNFLETLDKVSREQLDRRPAVNSGDERSVKNHVGGPEERTDEGQLPLPASIDPNLPVSREADPLRMESDLDLTAFLNVLSELGIDAGGGGTGLNAAADVNFADPQQIAAIKDWMARLQQNPQALTADLKTVVERVQQALAEALNRKSTLLLDGKAGQAIDSGMVTDTSPEDRFLKEGAAAATGQKAGGGWNDGIAASNVKVPEAGLSVDQTGTEKAAKLSDMKITSPNPDSGRSAAEVTGSLTTSTEGRIAAEAVKTAEMNHPSESESRPVRSEAKSVDTDTANSAKTGNTPSPGTAQPIAEALREDYKTTGRAEPGAENSIKANDARPSSQPASASDLNPALNRSSDVQLHRAVGEEPVSRLFQEARLIGGGVSRMEVDLNDEPTGKVVKSEAAAGENSLSNSSNQSAEKSAEGTPPAKDADPGPGVSRNQTLDQIVRRAALHLRNGQQEVRIDLKPEFLGHVRMQVISENHQVTVKILAEHGFVKEMIENNLHQLKADLQQQGLEVDKVEVSVSQDSEEGTHSREKLAQSKIRQGAAGHRDEPQASDEHESEPRHSRSLSDAHSTIDYFA